MRLAFDAGSVLSITGVLRWRSVRKVQFALLNRTGKGGLFRFVEDAVMIGVVPGDLGVHLADVVDHHFGIRFASIRRDVGREFDRAISNGIGESLLFFVVELAILVGVKGRNLREELREMRGSGSGIAVVLCSVVARGVSV